MQAHSQSAAYLQSDIIATEKHLQYLTETLATRVMKQSTARQRYPTSK
jgi:hypothetical protein